jgi:lipopolysaccharide transport system permease protein
MGGWYAAPGRSRESTAIISTVDAEIHAQDPTNVEWRVIRPGGRWRPGRLRELWASRELALILALRDLQLRYRQTIFGVGWAVLQPLAAAGVFSVIFGTVADIPSDGLPYPLFVLAALAVWSFMSTAVSAAAETLVEHRDLVTKVSFPRMLAPTAAVLAASVDLVVGLLLLAPVMAVYGIAPPLQAFTLPLWIGAALLVAVGAGLWLSAANVLYRDVRYTLSFLLQVWLFASPVVFPVSLIDGTWRYVLALNPLTGVISGVRWALLDGPAPGPWLAVSAVSLAALLISGALYFARAERTFADRI